MTSVAATAREGIALRAEEVGDRVVALLGSQGAANAALVHDRGAAVVFDAQASPTLGEAAAATVRARVGRAPAVLVNSHVHGDHTFGNQAFEGVPIMAHHETSRAWLGVLADRSTEGPLSLEERYRLYFGDFHWTRLGDGDEAAAALRARVAVPELERVLPRLPLVTFSDRLTFDLEAGPVELMHLGIGHTRGDLVAFLPRERVLFAGDLVVVDRVPLITDPTTAGWVDVLDRLAGLSIDRIVPGHGGVTGPDGIRFVRGYLTALRDAVRGAIEAGLSLAETRQAVQLRDYADLPRFSQVHSLNVSVVYAELAAERARTTRP